MYKYHVLSNLKNKYNKNIIIINKFSSRNTSDDKNEIITTKIWSKPLKTKTYGIDILHDSLWNKSMAFDYTERDRLGLRGLLPPGVRTIEEQAQRVITRLRLQPDDVTKNLYLQELHNRNETLYHRVLVDNIEELAPLVYTPTVGIVCQQFGYQFRKSRGMYFSREDKGLFNTMVYNWPHNGLLYQLLIQNMYYK